MAKFIDKQNLVQYKYFNNLIGKKDIVDEIASNYITGDHQLSNRHVQNNLREYRDSLLMLNKGKKDLPTALYSMREDQERCYNEIFYGNAKQTRQNANRYMDVLMFIRFYQGAQIKRNVEVAPEMLEGLSEKDMGNLDAMLLRDVHYILNVQCESQKDYAYLIAREENIYMRRLGKYALTPEIHIGSGEISLFS